MILRTLALLACLLCFGAQASPLFPEAHGQCVIQTCLNGTQSYSIGCGQISQSCPATTVYTGPVDAVAGATHCYALRACNAAYATGSNPAVTVTNLSAASENINILSSGLLDVTTANTFAGTDATASCTIASTTATCATASSTPHKGDQITGAGISGPCYAVSVGTFTAGSGTVTVPSTCGTVSVAVSTTFQGALQITVFFDNIGSANTSGGVPAYLLTKCLNGLTVPCVAQTGAEYTSATISSSSQPNTLAVIYERTGQFTTQMGIGGSLTNQIGLEAVVNDFGCYAGSTSTGTSADSTPHANACVFNNTSSYIAIDGTNFGLASLGTGNLGTTLWLGSFASNSFVLFGVWEEFILYNSALSPTNQVILCNNQRAFAGTPAC